MKTDFQNWVIRVSSLRAKLYALNYFTSFQLLRISNEFYCLINNSDHEINNEILLLLMSLSPDLTMEKIKEVTSTDEARSIALKSLTFVPPNHSEGYCALDDADIPGEIEKLKEAEKEIYYSCIKDYEFNPRMALAAIHQFGSKGEEVLKWCFDPKNSEKFESNPIVSEDSSTLEINVSNTTVQQLVELRFPESWSIEAVKSCGEDFTKCYDYCSKLAVKNVSFSGGTQDDISNCNLIDIHTSYKAKVVDPTSSKFV